MTISLATRGMISDQTSNIYSMDCLQANITLDNYNIAVTIPSEINVSVEVEQLVV